MKYNAPIHRAVASSAQSYWEEKIMGGRKARLTGALTVKNTEDSNAKKRVNFNRKWLNARQSLNQPQAYQVIMYNGTS